MAALRRRQCRPGSFGTRVRKPACPRPRFAAFPNDPGRLANAPPSLRAWRRGTGRFTPKPIRRRKTTLQNCAGRARGARFDLGDVRKPPLLAGRLITPPRAASGGQGPLLRHHCLPRPPPDSCQLRDPMLIDGQLSTTTRKIVRPELTRTEVGIAGRIAIGICNARRAAVESCCLPTPVRYGSVVVHARCALQANLIAMGAMGFSLLGIFQFFCTHIISRADPPTIFRLD